MAEVLFVSTFNENIKETVPEGYVFVNIEDPYEAVEYCKQQGDRVDAVVMSLRMAAWNGLDAMEAIHRNDPDMPVIISTHDIRVTSVVDAMQRGAFNYQYEKFAMRELPFILERALKYMQTVRANRAFRNQGSAGGFAGISPAAVELRSMITRVADSTLPILITGESGTGKEVAARDIHRTGPRAKRQFVGLNCGALSPTLLEAELFGYVKGAFTGADKERKGLFEQAHQGTLLLDELGETSPEFQVKLLRVLETGEVRRVGDTRDIQVDVRVLAATNKDLEEAVKHGSFRQDLLYRLNVISIAIPPLRERREDIPVLAALFLDEIKTRNEDAPEKISAAVFRKLEAYDWPGNARELRNVIERAVLMGDRRTIKVHDLPDALVTQIDLQTEAHEHGLEYTLLKMETRLIRQALYYHRGNRSKTARALQVKRTTLIEKMKRLGIS